MHNCLIFANRRSNKLGLVWSDQLALLVHRPWLWWFRARVRPPASCRSYPRGSRSFQDPASNSCKQPCRTARCSASSSPRYPPPPRPRQAQVWQQHNSKSVRLLSLSRRLVFSRSDFLLSSHFISQPAQLHVEQNCNPSCAAGRRSDPSRGNPSLHHRWRRFVHDPSGPVTPTDPGPHACPVPNFTAGQRSGGNRTAPAAADAPTHQCVRTPTAGIGMWGFCVSVFLLLNFLLFLFFSKTQNSWHSHFFTSRHKSHQWAFWVNLLWSITRKWNKMF